MIGLIVIGLLAISCMSATPKGDVNTVDTSNVIRTKEFEDYPESEQNDAGSESVTPAETDGTNDGVAADDQDSTQGSRQDSSSAGSTPQAPSSGSVAPSSESAPAQSQKTWVEDTKRIWVIDKEAWTESVPVYGIVEASICNICGHDVTGNTSAHAKEHMKAGEGSGHHSEVRQKITGYNTVSHPEEGHWETKVDGGHWDT